MTNFLSRCKSALTSHLRFPTQFEFSGKPPKVLPLLTAVEALEPRMMLSTVQLFVAGQTNQEVVDVVVNDQVIGTITNVGGDADSRQFASYEFETDAGVVPSNVRIQFRNDFSNGTIDRNVRVHSISVDGQRYAANDPAVFSTGTWRASDGCAPGFKQSQLLSCNGYLEFEVASSAIIQGSIGSAEVNHFRQQIQFDRQTNPVIIVGPPTFRGGSPGVAQVSNVTADSFELRFKEWNYLDFQHATEQVDWMALNEGRYTTGDGSIWEVGSLDVGGHGVWKSQIFTQSFARAPDVFVTLQTQNGAPAVVRVRNVTTENFQTALFEEELTQLTGHGFEVVGYLAIQSATDSGIVNIGSESVPYLVEAADVDENTQSLARNELFVQEERSADPEVGLPPERVSGLSLGSRFFATSQTANSIDTASIRKIGSSDPIQLPPGFVFEPIIEGLDRQYPIGVEVDAEGTLYLVDETGAVWLVKDGVRQSTPFLDIRSQVANLNAAGGQLSSFALDPDYENNGFVYVLYTTAVNGESFGRLERFTRHPILRDQVSPASSRILVGRTKIDGLLAGTFHSIGDIEFGRDGSILFSWGDASSNDANDPAKFNSQNLDLAAGKIFRVNAVTGQGFSSNPFYDGNLDSTSSKTWALGLRNGFRIEIKPGTGSTRISDANPGQLVITEVGDKRFEEVNIAAGGENFGWPYFEGNLSIRSDSNAIEQSAPALAIAHPESFSVIGGDFYQDSRWPSLYHNKFFVADFVAGWVRAYEINPDGSVDQFDFASGLKGISEMQYDPTTGDLLIVGRGRGTVFGADEGLSGIYRLRFVG